LIAAAFLENFGYRQLTTRWRFRGMVEYFSGKRRWGQIEKKGFTKKIDFTFHLLNLFGISSSFSNHPNK